MPNKSLKIYVAGHKGLVGSAIVRHIESVGQHTWFGASKDQLDLRDRTAVFEFMDQHKPDGVIIAAAKVGGMYANIEFPVEFLSDNIQIQTNLMDAAHKFDVENLVFLGSSCIYPKFAKQPISEDYLLTGPLEETNIAYSIAKIAGIKLVQAYRAEYGRSWTSAMPSNLYGPGDSFDPRTSHVLPALIRKFHEASVSGAESVTLWGSGSPRREFCPILVDADQMAAAYVVRSLQDLEDQLSQAVRLDPLSDARKTYTNSALAQIGAEPGVNTKNAVLAALDLNS